MNFVFLPKIIIWNGDKMELQASLMNDIQIKNAREQGNLLICPYESNNLTPIGYNLSFSRFIVSLRKLKFVKIYYKDNEWFFKIKPSETVLILTRETIWVSSFIGGTFHSKVSLVTKGLGHVSTTLDPGWCGQLLVPLNNPMKKEIKIVIARDVNNKRVYETFITMLLFWTKEAALGEKMDNKASRIELLEEILEKKKNNKDAMHLKKFIDKIKNNITYTEAYDELNNPYDRKSKIIDYEKSYMELLKEMDSEFDSINILSNQGYNKGLIKFWFIVSCIVMMLLAAVGVSFVYQNGKYKDYVNIAVSVAIPFVILGLNQLRDKLL